MNTLSNQTLQLAGGFVLALVLVLFVGALAVMETDIPDIMDRALYVILGSFLGVNAVNGVTRLTNGKK